MSSATMPKQRLTHTIGNMRVGERAWVTPWTMHVNQQKKCWIRTDAPALKKQGGIAQMLVTRRDDGYAVDISHCKGETWTPGCLGNHINYAPVVMLKGS